MEIGETGEHGEAVVGDVVVVAKLVQENAITLLGKTGGEIAGAVILKFRPATQNSARVITIAKCCLIIYILFMETLMDTFKTRYTFYMPHRICISNKI